MGRNSSASGFLLAAAAVLPLLVLAGCSDSVPELTEVSAALVASYPAEDVPPETRLSVFVLPSSDVGRVSHVDVVHPESGLRWRIGRPMVLTGGSKYRAGSPFLVPPYFSHVPQGGYELAYTDMSGRSASVGFSLSYPAALRAMTAAEAREHAASSAAEEKIAVYGGRDGTGTLLFYGEAKEGWSDRMRIAEEYEKAVSVRVCLELDGASVLCLMPPENIR